MDPQRSNGYKFGQWMAGAGKWVVGAIVGLVVAAQYFGPNLSAYLAEREKQQIIAQSAANRAEGAARRQQEEAAAALRRQQEEAQLAERCTNGLPAIVDQARDAAKAGDLEKAKAAMDVCAGRIVDPTLLVFHKNLSAAVAAKLAKEDREANARAAAALDLRAKQREREERADLARRKKQGVTIGMSRDDVLKSSWGRPERVNTTTSARGKREQWAYHGYRNYLYFENGVLTNIQN